jgi:tetratricopeptide (TPR) repeat protein
MKPLSATFKPVAVTALASAVALVGALASSSAWAQAAAPAASAASAPRFAVRPEVGAALNKAVEQFRAGQMAEARSGIEQAQATLKDLTPVEQTVMHRLRGLFALQMNDTAEAAKSLEAALAINAQSERDQLTCQENLARAHFNLKAYPAAIDWARKAQAAGSTSAPVQAVLVRALYSSKDYAGAITALEAQHKRSGSLPLDDLRLLASSYGLAKDDANYMRLAEQLLRDHGRTEYWPDLLARVQRQPSWQPRWDIDLFRLRFQLDMMEEGADYLSLADMTARAGLPAEAQKVLDAGFAKGMLGKGPNAAETQKFRESVTRQAQDDRQSLASAASRPPTLGDARAATNTFNTGLAMVSAGQAERGLELMKAALGGPLPDLAQSRLQYAQALSRAGRAAEADEQFKTVAGDASLGLLARLWQAAVSPKKS